jgi:chemotaxis protein MotB
MSMNALAAHRIVFGGSLVTLALGFAGCVPQEKYDAAVTAARSYEQQLGSTRDELSTSRANEDRLRSQISQARADLESMQGLSDGSKVDLEKLRDAYDALSKQVAGMDAGGPLPENINILLASLAEQYPDMLQFDAKTGMLRFLSDVTFDSGSARVKDSAREVLRRFAAILNNPELAAFETVVTGHTDNVRIGKPETLKNHPTNTHLSAHRAISVRDLLVGDGVSPNRVEVAGWGEYRPIVENGPRGAAQNRRVEVFIRPMTYDTSSGSWGGSGAGSSGEPRPAAAPRATPEKDSTAPTTAPVVTRPAPEKDPN